MEKHEPFRATLVLSPTDKRYIVHEIIPATLQCTEVIYLHANVCQGISNSSPSPPAKAPHKAQIQCQTNP